MAALAWVQFLAQELPHVTGEAKKKKKERKKEKVELQEFLLWLRSALTNPTRIHEDVGSIPDLTQWVKSLVWPWLW